MSTRQKLEASVLAVLAAILGIIVSYSTLSASFVSQKQFEERKQSVEAHFVAVESALKDIKDEQKEFRKESNEKLNTLIRRVPIRD